jgi:hypothetical protein
MHGFQVRLSDRPWAAQLYRCACSIDMSAYQLHAASTCSSESCSKQNTAVAHQGHHQAISMSLMQAKSRMHSC